MKGSYAIYILSIRDINEFKNNASIFRGLNTLELLHEILTSTNYNDDTDECVERSLGF